MKLPTSDLNRFEYQLNNPNQSIKSEIEIQQNVQRLKKNLVLAFPSDSTGCGHIRCIFPMNYLNAVMGPKEGEVDKSPDIVTTVSQNFIFQHDLLMRTRTLFFQRTMNPELLKHVIEYKNLKKKYGFNLVFDIDDFIFSGKEEGECIPDYNLASTKISLNVVESAIKIMNLMDRITVSTEFLKDYLVNKVKVIPPVSILPNAVPKYFWFNQGKRPKIKNRIEKPRVIYTGSPTHYCNLRRMKGDWDNAWCDWVIKNVKENKIEFLCMGGLPFFFEGIKNKIYTIDWLNSYSYHTPVLKFRPDFGIAPLVPNFFTYSKSNLKTVEFSAVGAIAIGTTFTNGKPSPYDNNIVSLPDTCNVEDIDKLIEFYKEPENFNDVIEKQYKYLEDNGHWLESEKYINLLTSLL